MIASIMERLGPVAAHRAFPFIMRGLRLLGLHDLGDFGLHWIYVDALRTTIGGIAKEQCTADTRSSSHQLTQRFEVIDTV